MSSATFSRLVSMTRIDCSASAIRCCRSAATAAAAATACSRSGSARDGGALVVTGAFPFDERVLDRLLDAGAVREQRRSPVRRARRSAR